MEALCRSDRWASGDACFPSAGDQSDFGPNLAVLGSENQTEGEGLFERGSGGWGGKNDIIKTQKKGFEQGNTLAE